MKSPLIVTSCMLGCILLIGCYSFKGISISDETNTYGVVTFTVDRGASLAPPDLGETFSEDLKEKVRQETRLKFQNEDSDVLFRGQIKRYDVLSVGPQGSSSQDQLDVGSELNRLRITVAVDYEDSNQPEYNFNKDFTFHADFNRDLNLSEVQDRLIDDIFDRLLEDVFNEAFSNW